MFGCDGHQYSVLRQLRQAKLQVYLDQHRDVGTAVAASEITGVTMRADYHEGVKAFTERRTPNWS